MGTLFLSFQSNANEDTVASAANSRSYAAQILRMVMGRETASEQFIAGPSCQ